MVSVRELLAAADQLPGDSGRREGEILLGHCLGKTRSWLYTWPEKQVAEADAQGYRQLLARREAGTPVAYLTGTRDFWSLQLKVSPDTLIPRAETETLVEWALELELSPQAAVLDLGTGSGAIALALASESPGWEICATDMSEAALAVAGHNREQCGADNVELLQSDWYAALPSRRFDLIVSNPPYIDPADHHLAEGDLRFEPGSALAAADGGMADLAAVIAGAASYLQSRGWLLLEHGFEQGEAVRTLLHEAGFSQVGSRLDLAGRERISGACMHVE